MSKSSDNSRTFRTNKIVAKRARNRTGLTQTEAAAQWTTDKNGISERTIRDIESGVGASAPKLRYFAERCGMSNWHDLLDEEVRSQFDAIQLNAFADGSSSLDHSWKQGKSAATEKPSQLPASEVVHAARDADTEAATGRKRWIFHETERHAFPELQYDNLYQVMDWCIPYVRLHGSRERNISEYAESLVHFTTDTQARYTFPPNLNRLPNPKIDHDGEKVRLSHYEVKQTGGPERETSLHVWFSPSPILYSYSCKVARHIDDLIADDKALPVQPWISYRDRFAPRGSIKKNKLPPELPNACGVGLFLIGRGKTEGSLKIVITHQAPNQFFSAGLWSYSASGSMDWPERGEPNPFEEIRRETLEETNYKAVKENIRLIGLGMDTKELYVQFSFVEETTRPIEAILDDSYHAKHEFEWDTIQCIDLTPDAVVEALMRGEWEPAAAAALLAICSKWCGAEHVSDRLMQALSKTDES